MIFYVIGMFAVGYGDIDSDYENPTRLGSTTEKQPPVNEIVKPGHWGIDSDYEDRDEYPEYMGAYTEAERLRPSKVTICITSKGCWMLFSVLRTRPAL